MRLNANEPTLQLCKIRPTRSSRSRDTSPLPSKNCKAHFRERESFLSCRTRSITRLNQRYRYSIILPSLRKIGKFRNSQPRFEGLMNTRPRFFCIKYQRYNKNSKLFIRYFSMYSLAYISRKKRRRKRKHNRERKRESIRRTTKRLTMHGEMKTSVYTVASTRRT